MLERTAFNLPLLKEILDGYLVKSGVAEDTWSEFSMQHIFPSDFSATEGKEAEANLIQGVIKLDSNLIEKYELVAEEVLRNAGQISEKDRKDFVEAFVHYKVIHNFVHEYIHLRGHIHSEQSPNEARLEAGYDQRTATRLLSGEVVELKINVSLNEAVTEKMAHEIYREYSRRTGDARKARIGQAVMEMLEKVTRITLDKEDLGGYENIIGTFDIILDHLADELEWPREKVWESFKQGYFAGLPRVSELLLEISEFLNEEFPRMEKAEHTSKGWTPALFREKLRSWEEKRGKTIADQFSN